MDVIESNLEGEGEKGIGARQDRAAVEWSRECTYESLLLSGLLVVVYLKTTSYSFFCSGSSSDG